MQNQSVMQASAHPVLLQTLVGAGLVCCALACVAPAHAGPGPEPQGRPERQEDGGGRVMRAPPQARPVSREVVRDGAGPRGEAGGRPDEQEARRRAAAMQESYATRAAGIDAAKRNSRLTPEERRDLRRQINEAGQDLYARPPNR